MKILSIGESRGFLSHCIFTYEQPFGLVPAEKGIDQDCQPSQHHPRPEISSNNHQTHNHQPLRIGAEPTSHNFLIVFRIPQNILTVYEDIAADIPSPNVRPSSKIKGI